VSLGWQSQKVFKLSHFAPAFAFTAAHAARNAGLPPALQARMKGASKRAATLYVCLERGAAETHVKRLSSSKRLRIAREPVVGRTPG